MILITGSAGFIGSCLVGYLNRSKGRDDLILVDHLDHSQKWRNLNGLDFDDYHDRSQIEPLLSEITDLDAIVHLGACTDTGESDSNYLIENNYRYSLELARYALDHQIPFIYASSAATYGDGSQGYEVCEDELHRLRPLNGYGFSKHLFDLKARRLGWLDQITGLKFFNVYGPNEYHKGAMASVIFQAYNQISASGQMKLFRSHRPDVEDGQQVRDFIYVKDIVEAIGWLLEHPEVKGIYNLGTGRARSFLDFTHAVFKAMNREPDIVYIDIPQAYRQGYQYYTCAEIGRNREAGLPTPRWTLEQGVTDYVQNHLLQGFAPY